jgi:hypothetical protein
LLQQRGLANVLGDLDWLCGVYGFGCGGAGLQLYRLACYRVFDECFGLIAVLVMESLSNKPRG